MSLLGPIKKLFKSGPKESTDEQGDAETNIICEDIRDRQEDNQSNENSKEFDALFNGYNSEQQSDDKTARLMSLVGEAIETWAKEYNMERLPRKIIFAQAMDAMKAMEPLFKRM